MENTGDHLRIMSCCYARPIEKNVSETFVTAQKIHIPSKFIIDIVKDFIKFIFEILLKISHNKHVLIN